MMNLKIIMVGTIEVITLKQPKKKLVTDTNQSKMVKDQRVR